LQQDAPHKFVFPRWTNYLLPLMVLGAMGGGLYVLVIWTFGASAETLNTGYQPDQPIPYSHELHAGQLGIDCKYCHTTADKASFAAIPSTDTCINCHNPKMGLGVRKNSDKLKPLFESYETGNAPVDPESGEAGWTKVHDLADYVYFNHSAHVNRGVSCKSCHGRVDKMGEEGVHQVEPLSMGWCLDCHREPEQHLRPVDEVTNMTWQAIDSAWAKEGDTEAQAQLRVGEHMKEKLNIRGQAYMTACSTCHR
jgi:hypothetical protein